MSLLFPGVLCFLASVHVCSLNILLFLSCFVFGLLDVDGVGRCCDGMIQCE